MGRDGRTEKERVWREGRREKGRGRGEGVSGGERGVVGEIEAVVKRSQLYTTKGRGKLILVFFRPCI